MNNRVELVSNKRQREIHCLLLVEFLQEKNLHLLIAEKTKRQIEPL